MSACESDIRSGVVTEIVQPGSAGRKTRSSGFLRARASGKEMPRCKVGDVPGNLFAFILLQEMARSPDHDFRLAGCRRNQLAKPTVAARGDWIAIRKEGKRRLGPARQGLPG